MRRNMFAATTAAAVALAIAAVASAGGNKPTADAGRPLAGTWMTTVTLQNPPPGIDATFLALDTFLPGGGLLVSSSQSNPTLRSLAHGAWTRMGGQQFGSAFLWFRFDTTGKFVGMQRVRRTMTLAPKLDTFQATDTVEILAPDGTVVATIQATETGHRLGA